MLSRYKYLLLILLVFSGTSIAQSNQIDPEKKQMIVHLMDITGVSNIAKVYLDQMSTIAAKSNNPKAKEYFQRFQNKFPTAELYDVYISIYDRHFSKDDLKGLISFYETPLGRKLISETPALTKEGIQAGAAIGKRVGQEVEAEMAAEKSSTKPAK